MNLKAKPFYLADADIKWVNDTLMAMSEEEMIMQLFCLIAYSSEQEYLNYLSKKLKIGGIMCRTMPSAEVVKTVDTLQKSSKIPMLIAANLECGGNGVAYEGTRVGCQMAVAAAKDNTFAKKLGNVCGIEGSALGVNWAFAPVVDIDCNFRNPITNTRTFGSNPQKVKDHAEEYVKAVQSHGVAAAIKHFPGDGVDERDQHLVTSVNGMDTEQWDNSFGMVYKGCIDIGALTVMVGHIMLPSYSKKYNINLRDEDILPATLSYDITTKLLKQQLGFNGVVITDSTTMAGFNMVMERKKAVPMAIAAGCDMFLFTKNLEEDIQFMKDGVTSGIISHERLVEAVTKILALKAALSLHNKTNAANTEKVATLLGCDKHVNFGRQCADESITLVKDKENILPISPLKYKRVLFYSIESDAGEMGAGVLKGANNNFMRKLSKAGFNVTEFKPKTGFEGMMSSANEIVSNYDLIIYSANMATKSNQTVVRIEWAQPMGANIPTYMKSVPTIFVSLENPYHLLDVPRVKTYINTYGSSDIILDSLVEKLLGKSSFKGESPVDAFCGKWDTKL